MKLDQAFQIARWVVDEAPGPVSVYVADDHGELVVAATMDEAIAQRLVPRHLGERSEHPIEHDQDAAIVPVEAARVG